MAFSRAAPEGERRIGVASLANPTDVQILTGDDQGLWTHDFPAWSPDGKDICYATHNNLWIVPASGGDARRLTTEGIMDSEPAWSPDGRDVYFSSYREGTAALWRVRAKGGEPKRVSPGTGAENAPSISRDGTRLAFCTETVTRNLVIRDLESGREVTLPNLQDAETPTLSPDGKRVVFGSMRWGAKYDLWSQTLGPGNSQGKLERLTDHPGYASHPKFSPDGKWIAYYRIIGEERDIWVIPASGGQPIQFTVHSAPDIHPAWSPDGSTLAYVSEREGGQQIWLAPIKDGKRAGEPRQLTNGELSTHAPVWSPDGKWIAFLGIHENEKEAWMIPVDGSMPPQQLTEGANVMRVRWDPSGGGLLVSGIWDGRRYSLRTVSTTTGECLDMIPSIVLGTRMASALFDVSKDGRLLIYSQEVLKGNIWVLDAVEEIY
jgi:Tol biopolymer transport system component